jgi:hypothetical protein
MVSPPFPWSTTLALYLRLSFASRGPLRGWNSSCPEEEPRPWPEKWNLRVFRLNNTENSPGAPR